MLVYQFPGQGAQYKGMGKDLFPEFPALVKKADEILGYSLITLCLEDPQQLLNQTQYTQPAIYAVNALSYLKRIQTTAQKPDFVIGHSLGEYNALFAANVFDFATGLILVKKRGELMSQVKNGGMLALMGLTSQKINSVLQENNLKNLAIANYNTYTQSVISGLATEIELATTIFSGIPTCKVFPLKVSGPFHTFHMHPAEVAFMQFIETISFGTPTIPVLANIDAKPYHPNIIKSNLTRQITHSVQWLQIMQYLTRYKSEFNELGNAKILTRIHAQICENQ